MLNKFIDLSIGNVSHAERLTSTVGGSISIFAIFIVNEWYPGPEGMLSVVQTRHELVRDEENRKRVETPDSQSADAAGRRKGL
jgi:hypothetical protein